MTIYRGIARDVSWTQIPRGGESSPYHLLTFRIECFDEEGNVIKHIPVELSEAKRPQNIAVDGDQIEVSGKFNENNILQAKKIKNINTHAEIKAKVSSGISWRKFKKLLSIKIGRNKKYCKRFFIITGITLVTLAIINFCFRFWPVILNLMEGGNFKEALEPAVTVEEYIQVENGMNYLEVKSIFGSPGKLYKNTQVREKKYKWLYANTDHILVDIEFSNNYSQDLDENYKVAEISEYRPFPFLKTFSQEKEKISLLNELKVLKSRKLSLEEDISNLESSIDSLQEELNRLNMISNSNTYRANIREEIDRVREGLGSTEARRQDAEISIGLSDKIAKKEEELNQKESERSNAISKLKKVNFDIQELKNEIIN